MNNHAILRKMSKSKLFIIGLIGLILLALVVIVGPIICPYNPTVSNLRESKMAPEWFSRGINGHIFGTDSLGRDVLARMLLGGRYSLMIAFSVVAISTLLGTAVGLVAGYYGGWVDTVLMRFCEILLGIPQLMLAVCIVAVLGTNNLNLIITMSITGWTGGARIARSGVLQVRKQEYISAAKVMGEKNSKILWSEIFPNITTPIIITCTMRLGGTILAESGMSYLGLGIPAPTPSWGTMIADGRDYLTSCPWIVVCPGVMLMLTVLFFNFLGDGIRDVFDPKNTN